MLGRFVAEVGEDYLLHHLGLTPDGRCDRWFAVAVQGHPPAADRVNQFASIIELQLTAGGAIHPKRLRMQGDLGRGVPEVRVPGHPG